MKAMWRKRYDVQSLIEKIHRLQSSIEVEFYFPTLVSAAEWPKDVPGSERLGMVRECVAPKKTGGPPTPEEALKRLDRLQRNYLARPWLEYVLVTSLSLVSHLRIRKRVARNAEARFAVQLPRAYREELGAPEAQRHGIPKDPVEYKKVEVRTRARTPEEARLRLFEALDLIRGIWNYGLGYNRMRMTFAGFKNKPFNEILLGPRFAVYEGDSHEPTERGSASLYSARVVGTAQQWQVVKDHESRIRRALRRIKYSEQLERAVVRFCRALDERDLDASLLKLWTVLEMLTCSSGGRHDQLVKRVSALWNDEEPHRSNLQHLRDQRNQIAHEGEGSDFSEAQVGQLRFYAQQLFIYHFSQGHKFGSLGEAGEVLDLPTQLDRLKREIELRKVAVAIRSDGS